MASEEDLQAVDGVGATVARDVAEFFGNERNRATIDDLRAAGVEPQPAETADDELDGLTFVFTGSLDGMTRGEAQELVERHGGSATSSVSGNTDYLVVGETPGRSKRETADEHGVETLSQSEFEALLSDRGVER